MPAAVQRQDVQAPSAPPGAAAAANRLPACIPHWLLSASHPRVQPSHCCCTRAAAARKLATVGKGFLAGCVASCGAVAVTNPVDVIRTRLELQGELASGGAKLYRGAIHGGRAGWVAGLQRRTAAAPPASVAPARPC